MAQRRAEMRARVGQWKLDRGCVDCGYAEHACALDFDHVTGEKVADIATLVQGASWDRILAEIAKCEVVCANCHRVRTQTRR